MDRHKYIALSNALDKLDKELHTPCKCSGFAIQMGDCVHIELRRAAEMNVILAARELVDG